MNNNDDPIKEVGSYKFRFKKSIYDNDINSNYSDDLHNCSTDLSEKGSITEEKEHAEFAKQKRQELFNKIYSYKSDSITEPKTKNLVIIIMIIIITFFGISSLIINSISTIVEQFVNNISEENLYVETEDEISEEEQQFLFEQASSNIVVNSMNLPDGSMLLTVTNNNLEVFNNIRVQTIFYDAENKPIKICENNINTLFKNGNQICEVIDLPAEYSSFQFLVTQSYIVDVSNIELSDLEFYVTEDSAGDFDISVTNNSTKKIDNLDIVAIYYLNGEIISIHTDYIFDIGPGDTQTEQMYNLKDKNTYDDVKFIVNDISILE